MSTEFQQFHRKVKDICRQKRVKLKKLEIIKRPDMFGKYWIRCMVEIDGKSVMMNPKFVYGLDERQVQIKRFLDGFAAGLEQAKVKCAMKQKEHVLQSEPLPQGELKFMEPPERMLKFFVHRHLPPPLQEIAKPYLQLAEKLIELTPSGPERTVALRKLLESKDSAVRARVEERLGNPAYIQEPLVNTPEKELVHTESSV